MLRYRFSVLAFLFCLSAAGTAHAQCGYVTYEGCCNGQTLKWCEGSQLQTLDCTLNPNCGWSLLAGYYDCGTAGGSDPLGQNPKWCAVGPCNGITYDGCCDGQVLKWCENNVLLTIDCGQNPSCGWSAAAGYYDCGTTGGTDPTGQNPKSCTPVGAICGDGLCNGTESGATCPADCSGNCGNGVCDLGEDYHTCKADCKIDSPICGDGTCAAGETSTTCPADCGQTGPVCGNGNCEAGETASSCASDCGGTCQPKCEGKQCGFDGCGGLCGECPLNYTCNGDNVCEPDNPQCQPECAGKECGPNGCGGLCGACGLGLECSSGVCVEPWEDGSDGENGYDDVLEGDSSGNCVPECSGTVCGFDGCGGSCGTCPSGYECNDDGMCMEISDPLESVYTCEEGKILMYGKCVISPSLIEGAPSGCSHSRAENRNWLGLLLVVLLGLVVLQIRRRSTQ